MNPVLGSLSCRLPKSMLPTYSVWASSDYNPDDMKKIAPDRQQLLDRNSAVSKIWKTLTPIAQRDFISWIESAKQVETRKRRIEQMGDKLLSGKRRPCCYAIVPMDLYSAVNKNSKAKAVWKGLLPDERRDFVQWIASTKDKKEHSKRIEKVKELLAGGKKHL